MKVCTDACLFGAWTVRHLKDAKNILDIGTGTGLLSLMIVQKSPGLVDAIEYDHESYLQAEQNITASSWSDRINIIEGDVRHYPFKRNYDFIITNPPFFESDLQSPEQNKNLAKHSIMLSLQELIKVVDQILKPQGFLAILLPFQRTVYFKKIASEFGFFLKEEMTVRQTPDHDPFRSLAIYSRDLKEPTVCTEMSIKKDRKYTDKFTLLLKDYYEDTAFSNKS